MRQVVEATVGLKETKFENSWYMKQYHGLPSDHLVYALAPTYTARFALVHMVSSAMLHRWVRPGLLRYCGMLNVHACVSHWHACIAQPCGPPAESTESTPADCFCTVCSCRPALQYDCAHRDAPPLPGPGRVSMGGGIFSPQGGVARCHCRHQPIRVPVHELPKELGRAEQRQRQAEDHTGRATAAANADGDVGQHHTAPVTSQWQGPLVGETRAG
jgi:hypothetical protein